MDSAPWFALVGVIGDGPLFQVGDLQNVSSPVDAELRGFANDFGFMYWNNRGTIQVRVSPLDDI